jgi:protease-4
MGNFFRALFWPITAPIVFIQNHFKAVLLVLVLLFVIFSTPTPTAEPNLMRIDLKGAIVDSDRFLEQVEKARKPYIKGVLLHVDSPGGSVPPSVEMMLAIAELAEEKPVLAYASGVMASGSYYAAIGADEIVAHPGSIVGSIGVIMQGVNTEELLERIGVSMNIVKEGEYKEAGAFYREWTPGERSELQRVAGRIYDRFVADVARTRGLEVDDADRYANGRIFTGEEALEVGLIDSLMSASEAKTHIESLAGVDKPRWYEKDRFERLLDRVEQQAKAAFVAMLSPKVQAQL